MGKLWARNGFVFGDLRGFVMLILGFLWRNEVNGVIMGYNVCIIYIR